MLNLYLIKNTRKFLIIENKHNLKLPKRYMLKFVADCWKKVSITAAKKTPGLQQRHYPYAANKFSKDAVTLDGKPVESVTDLAKKKDRLFLSRQGSNEIEAALTQQNSGIIDNVTIVPGSERASGLPQQVASTIDTLIIADLEAVTKETRAQAFLNSKDKEITEAIKKMNQNLANANIQRNEIPIVNKKNSKNYQHLNKKNIKDESNSNADNN